MKNNPANALFLLFSTTCLHLALAHDAPAGVIYFAGVITSTTANGAALPTDVVSGAAFTGQLTYNDAAAGQTNGAAGDTNNMIYFNSITAFNVQIGATTYDLASLSSAYGAASNTAYSNWTNILNNEFPSGGKVSDIFATSVGSYDYSHRDANNNQIIRLTSMGIQLEDTSASPTALSSAALSGVSLDLSQFPDGHYLAFQSRDELYGTSLTFSGNITYLSSSPAAVPEPSSLILFGLAFAGQAGRSAWRWRRRAPNAKNCPA